MRHVHSQVATVFEAARLVRHQMELFVSTLPQDEQKAFEVFSLLGACGIASYCLQRVLRQVDVRSDFVMGRFLKNEKEWEVDRGQHCWVDVINPNLRVDITATQFGIPAAVHVTSYDDSQYRLQWRNRAALNHLRSWESQSHLRHMDRLDQIVKDCVAELHQSEYVTQE